MLAFTSRTQEALHWFTGTHEVEPIGLGGAIWRLKRLPVSGGLDDQDAWLMAALTFCRSVSNVLLADKRQAESDLEELHDIHEGHRRETRGDTVH